MYRPRAPVPAPPRAPTPCDTPTTSHRDSRRVSTAGDPIATKMGQSFNMIRLLTSSMVKSAGAFLNEEEVDPNNPVKKDPKSSVVSTEIPE